MALESTLKKSTEPTVAIIPPVAAAPAVAPSEDVYLVSSLALIAKGVRGVGVDNSKGNGGVTVTESSLAKLEQYVTTQQAVSGTGKIAAEYIERISLSNGQPISLGMAQMDKKGVAEYLGKYSSMVLGLYSSTAEDSPARLQLKDMHDRVENFRRDLQDDKYSFSANKSERNRLINDLKTFSADLNNDATDRVEVGKRLNDTLDRTSGTPGSLAHTVRSNPSMTENIRTIAGRSTRDLSMDDPSLYR